MLEVCVGCEVVKRDCYIVEESGFQRFEVIGGVGVCLGFILFIFIWLLLGLMLDYSVEFFDFEEEFDQCGLCKQLFEYVIRDDVGLLI